MIEISERLYTVEELWELIGESDDYKLAELIDGELIVVRGSGAVSAILAGSLLTKIANFVYENKLGYVTGADGHFVLATEPKSVAVIPDVAFVRKDRMPKPVPKKFIHLAPDLAIEVISPTDRAKDIRRKIDTYLKYDTELIWIVYPASERIDVYRLSDKTHTETLGIDDTLSGENVLSGFQLSIKDIFASAE